MSWNPHCVEANVQVCNILIFKLKLQTFFYLVWLDLVL